DEAMALHRAGQDKAGLAIVDPIVAEASKMGYAPLSVAVQTARGELYASAGQSELAAGTLSRAYFDARRIGDDETSARTASDLVQTLGVDLARFDTAATWIELARA